MANELHTQYQIAHVNDDRSHEIVISHALFLPLAVVAVVLRLLSRRICKAKILADDYMIIAALVRVYLLRILHLGSRADFRYIIKVLTIGELTGGLLCKTRISGLVLCRRRWFEYPLQASPSVEPNMPSPSRTSLN